MKPRRPVTARYGRRRLLCPGESADERTPRVRTLTGKEIELDIEPTDKVQ